MIVNKEVNKTASRSKLLRLLHKIGIKNNHASMALSIEDLQIAMEKIMYNSGIGPSMSMSSDAYARFRKAFSE